MGYLYLLGNLTFGFTFISHTLFSLLSENQIKIYTTSAPNPYCYFRDLKHFEV